MAEQKQGGHEYRCDPCNQTFNSSDELRRHNEQSHGQGKNVGQGQNYGQGQSSYGQGQSHTSR